MPRHRGAVVLGYRNAAASQDGSATAPWHRPIAVGQGLDPAVPGWSGATGARHRGISRAWYDNTAPSRHGDIREPWHRATAESGNRGTTRSRHHGTAGFTHPGTTVGRDGAPGTGKTPFSQGFRTTGGGGRAGGGLVVRRERARCVIERDAS